jgi:hypothetical protein
VISSRVDRVVGDLTAGHRGFRDVQPLARRGALSQICDLKWMQVHHELVSQRRVVIPSPARASFRSDADWTNLRGRNDRLFFRLVDQLKREHISRCQRRIVSPRRLANNSRCRRNGLEAGKADVRGGSVAADLVEERL